MPAKAPFIRTKKWAGILIFFILFFLTGILTAGSYGPGWDELDEINILRMNLLQYARSTGMDETVFVTLPQPPDELMTGTMVPISESIEKDHGISPMYFMAPAVLNRELSPLALSRLWHMGCWVWFTLAALGLYGCLQQLDAGPYAALLGPLFLLLSPQLFAQGHFNNKDIPLMALTALSMWLSLKLMRSPTVRSALLFALCGALAANVKIIGGLLWGICALCLLIRHIAAHTMGKKTWQAAAAALIAFPLLYLLVTPAMWPDPAGFVKYLLGTAVSFNRWSGLLLFRGSAFSPEYARLPRYYLPWMIAVTTPLWLLMLTAAGQFFLAANTLRKQSETRFGSAMLFLTLMLPLGAAVILGVFMYNGWRHFYFLAAPMTAGAAWAAVRISRSLSLPMKRVWAGAIAVCMLISGTGLVLEHPNQQAYLNPAVTRSEIRYDLDYWNISVTGSLKRFIAALDEPVRMAGTDYFSAAGLKRSLYYLPENEACMIRPCEADEAEYLLENTSYSRLAGPVIPDSWECVQRESAYGLDILRIYRKTDETADSKQ